MGACLNIMQTTEIRRGNNVVEFTDGGNLWYRLLYKRKKSTTSEKKDLKGKVPGRQTDRKKLP